MMEKHFNKNLFMPAEEEERFQLGNSCGICDKLFKDAEHWSCNVDLKLSKKFL